MAGKRHASNEIAAKLAQANELAAKGKTQREISKALGVSIMTYHRWKTLLHLPEVSAAASGRAEMEDRLHALRDVHSTEKIRRLELENSQLRRLLTDILLEKLNLEEELHAPPAPQRRRPDNG